MIDWLQLQLRWRSEPGLWILGSFLFLALGRALARRRAYAILRAWLEARGLYVPFWWTARLAYLTGLPYLALLAGPVSPRNMGLNDLDWVNTLGLGAPLAAAAWGALMIRLRQGGVFRRQPEPTAIESPNARALAAALEAGGQQIHWAFYRSAAIDWWGLYWGTWGTLLLIAAQWATAWLLEPERRSPASGGYALLAAALAILTAAFYLIVPNWWLGWALHFLTLLGTRSPLGPRPDRPLLP